KTLILKSRFVLFHIIFWAVIYLLWIMLFQHYSIRLIRTMTIEFCYLIFITTDIYLINNFIIPRFLSSKRYFAFALSVILCISISALLRSFVAVQMNLYYFHDRP